MNKKNPYNIQKDEYGYSIYWGRHTRIEAGSPRLAEVRRRRVEIEALSRALTILAEQGETVEHTMADKYARLERCISAAALYYGRTMANIETIALQAVSLYR